MASKGQLVRDSKGQFIVGTSSGGRPKGSKNAITLQKLLLEEAVRNENEEAIRKVLKLVIDQALKGNHASQKMVWEASMSKQQLAEDRAAGAKQTITVHTMNVDKKEIIEGEFNVETTEEEIIQ